MSVGEYTRSQLLELVDSHESLLVIHGPHSFESSGAAETINSKFDRSGTTFLSTAGGDPTVAGISRLLKEIQGVEIDAILVVGGGSVIDTGKLLKTFKNAPQALMQCLHGSLEIEPDSIPLYVLPTLVGSGSEVTHFAVIYDGVKKYSVAHDRLRPDGFAYNAEYVRRAPAHAFAASALDGLCQAIESYWCIHSTGESRNVASESIELMVHCIRGAVIGRSLPEIEKLQRAVNLAGRAIDITKTTAPHAVSYALSSCYSVAHGHAVSLLLPAFFEFNGRVDDSDCLDKRGADFVRERIEELRDLLGVSTNSDVQSFFDSLLRDFSLSSSLREVGIRSDEDVQRVVKNGFNPQRVNNNPRKLTPAGLTSLLASKCQSLESFESGTSFRR